MSSVKEKILKVHTILDGTYPPDISFLENRDPFQFLVSVILSAQTTDSRVNTVAPVLFDKYPKPQDLADADIGDVERIIHSTGFYKAKAKNITACARKIVEDFNGIVPTEMDDLLTLPGVGRKTANCLRANIYGKPGIVVDTHFSRVTNRIFGLGTRDPLAVEGFVCSNLEDKNWNRFSMTVNLHGREVCHSAKPECGICMVKNLCMEFGSSEHKDFT